MQYNNFFRLYNSHNEALEVLKQNKHITTIETWTDFPRSWDFWDKLGAESVHEEAVSRLY